MGSLPDDYPFCLTIDANGNTEWSPLQYQQKLAYDVMLTKIPCGTEYFSSKYKRKSIQCMEISIEYNNKKYKYEFIIDHWARPISCNDTK